MNNIQIISDKNLRSLKIKYQLLKKLNQFKNVRPNIIIVIGGMVYASNIKKKQKNKKIFLWY